MKSDAKEHAAEDKEKKELIDVQNEADSIAFQGEKQLTELGEKLDADTKGKIQAALDRVKSVKAGTDKNEIRSAIDDYQKLWQDASAKMYEQTAKESASGGGQQGPDQQGPNTPPPSDGEQTQDTGGENVENADFEVVDDDKKDDDK